MNLEKKVHKLIKTHKTKWGVLSFVLFLTPPSQRAISIIAAIANQNHRWGWQFVLLFPCFMSHLCTIASKYQSVTAAPTLKFPRLCSLQQMHWVNTKVQLKTGHFPRCKWQQWWPNNRASDLASFSLIPPSPQAIARQVQNSLKPLIWALKTPSAFSSW